MAVFPVSVPLRLALGLALIFCLGPAAFAAGPPVNAGEARHKAQPDNVVLNLPATPGAGRTASRAVITVRNLFGPAAEGTSEEAAVGEPHADPPATSLDLVLMGIVDGGNRDRRAVILSKKDRVQQLCQVGDQVAGAQVVRILWGKVVLRTDAGDEILDMREAADYRVMASQVVAAAAGTPAVASPATAVAPDDSRQADDDNLIPERVRLVLPDQEGTPVENGEQGDAEQGQ